MKKFLPKSVNNPSGFTLVELLVVISIIAILSVIGIVVFTSFQKGARDAVRKEDIRAIGNAMEAHFNQTAASGCTGGTVGQYCALANTFFASGQIPKDPTSSGAYIYCVKTAGTFAACAATDTVVGSAQPPAGSTYTVCANLENAGTGPGGTSYVCAQNQQ